MTKEEKEDAKAEKAADDHLHKKRDKDHREEVFLPPNIAHKMKMKLVEARSSLTPNFRVHGKEQRFCDVSLYFFDNKSKFRYYCVWLVEWKWFEHFLTTCIMINAINIATNDYEHRITNKQN